MGFINQQTASNITGGHHITKISQPWIDKPYEKIGGSIMFNPRLFFAM